MKIIIAGGTGHIGEAMVRHFNQQGHQVFVLSRKADVSKNQIRWDGIHLDEWAQQIDGADIVVNLAGRTVNCRYTKENLQQMMDSRVQSTRVIGEAIALAKNPPSLWLQMSTATIYAHRFDQPNDELNGIIGGQEKNVPAYWKYSIDIAENWEMTLNQAGVSRTRKVALRTAMVMGFHPESVFGVLKKMTLLRLGGAIAGGRQFVSWIHEKDFLRAVDFIIQHSEIVGAVNICAPHPLVQKDFMKTLRQALNIKIGLPAMAWMAEVGAFFLRTDTELLLKSRRVIPTRLLNSGFQFLFPTWKEASLDLVKNSEAAK